MTFLKMIVKDVTLCMAEFIRFVVRVVLGSNTGRAPIFVMFLSFGQQRLIIIIFTMCYGFIKY